MNVSFDVQGVQQAISMLSGAKRKLRNKVLRKAFNRGATVCAKAVRRNTPRDTGTAKKNVAKNVLVTGDENPEAKIGHRNLGKVRKNPAKYSHLMERGAKSHTILPRKKKALLLSFGSRRGVKTLVFAGKITHPGATARHVIERSFRESSSQAVSVIASVVAASIPQDLK